MSRAASVVLLLLVSACSANRNVAPHLNPELTHEQARAAAGEGFSPIPSSTIAATLARPVIVLPFTDFTFAPSGSCLDERSHADPVGEVYLLPDFVEHLRDRFVDTLREGGARVYRAYDFESVSSAQLGVRADILQVFVDHFEHHRWTHEESNGFSKGMRIFDVARVSYRYRWSSPAGVREEKSATHYLLLPPDSDVVETIARYMLQHVARSAGATYVSQY